MKPLVDTLSLGDYYLTAVTVKLMTVNISIVTTPWLNLVELIENEIINCRFDTYALDIRGCNPLRDARRYCLIDFLWEFFENERLSICWYEFIWKGKFAYDCLNCGVFPLWFGDFRRVRLMSYLHIASSLPVTVDKLQVFY